MTEPEKGFAGALASETLAKLTHFAETGEMATIDLGGLPMSNRDRAALDDFLGCGEVSATIEVIGRTEVWETQFSGVWRVRHFGEGAIATDLIEISACPKILFADRRDAESAARHLAEALELNPGIVETPHEI
ncbi:hydrogenase expression/formation C-terminal domain-containing protein [Rhodoblastus sp.]